MEETNTNNVETENGSNEGQEQHIDIGLDRFKHENGKIFGKFDDAVSFGNAYRELEKMNTKTNQELSSLKQANVAPEKYTLTLDAENQGKFEFDENSAEYQTYMPIFKELGLSNDKVNKIVNAYVKNQIASDVDYDTEIQKIGGENGETMKTINGFVAKNPDLLDYVSSHVVTAEDAQFMEKLIKAARGNISVPETTSHTNLSEPTVSKQEYKDMAYKYQEDHKDSIRYNVAEQQEYMRLLSLGL